MRLGVIYKLTVVGTPHFLYGSTIQKFHRRIDDYKRKLKKGVYGNSKLQNCYNKYGKDSLVWEIVQEGIPEDIIECVEDIWIGANCARIEDGKGGMNMRDATVPRHSQETKDKIRKSLTGRKLSEEHKKAVSEGNKGKKMSKESVEKTRLGSIGRKWTEEQRKSFFTSRGRFS